jgi:hypothetical protein
MKNIVKYLRFQSLDNTLKDVTERFVRDFQTHGDLPDMPSSPTLQLLKEVTSSPSHNPPCTQILHFLPRVEGDGAESPDIFVEASSTGRLLKVFFFFFFLFLF